MAAARKSGARSGGTDDEQRLDTGDEYEGAEVSAEDRLAIFFGESPESARFAVYEVDPEEPKKPSFLFRFSADEALEPDLLLSQLLESYGAGEYEIMARDATTGHIKLRQRLRVGSQRNNAARRIVPDPPGGRRGEASEAAAPASPQQQQPSGVSPDLQAILENQNKMLERLLETMATQQQPAQQSDPLEQIERLERMRQTFQPKEKTESLAEQIETLLNIRDKLSSETGEQSPLASAAKTLGPAIERALDRFSGAGPSGDNTVQNPATAGGDQSTGAEESPMRAMLTQLRTLAEQQTPADQAADHICTVLSQQPAWLEQTVLNFVIEGPEQAAGELEKFDPSLSQYRSWLIEVAQHIERAIQAAEAASAEAVHDAAKSGAAEGTGADAGGDS